jgi:branched-chain amino acid transport system substrate-binding protein
VQGVGRRVAAGLTAAATLASWGCSRRLLVGVVLPDSGSAAVYGASVKSGVTLAFGDAQAARTAPQGLEVIYRDSGSDPARAVSAAEALYDEGALVIIGGVTSVEAKAMIPVADRWERVLVSPSASAPDLARMSIYFFRLFPSDDLEGVKAADLLALTRHAATVVILQEDNTYTRGLLPVFMAEYRNQGGQVVGSVRIGDEGWERELRETLTARKPQGIYVCGYGDVILEALRVLRSLDYGGSICTTSAINVASFLQRAGKLAEGVFLPLAGLDTSSPKSHAQEFIKRYKEVYNLEPDIYAAHGYDAALATLYALTDLRTHSGSEVQLHFKALADKWGVTGPLAFDDYGNIKHYPRSHWIHDGRVEDYDAYVAREKERIRRQMEKLLSQGGGS